MDIRNRSIPVENVTSFDVNKAIQRSLTKACARHGLGLYIYAGEDLPESEQQPVEIPNVSADTLRKEIFVIAAAKGYTEEQMTANPYKKYANKMFADLTVDELRDLKRTLAQRKDK